MSSMNIFDRGSDCLADDLTVEVKVPKKLMERFEKELEKVLKEGMDGESVKSMLKDGLLKMKSCGRFELTDKGSATAAEWMVRGEKPENFFLWPCRVKCKDIFEKFDRNSGFCGVGYGPSTDKGGESVEITMERAVDLVQSGMASVSSDGRLEFTPAGVAAAERWVKNGGAPEGFLAQFGNNSISIPGLSSVASIQPINVSEGDGKEFVAYHCKGRGKAKGGGKAGKAGKSGKKRKAGKGGKAGKAGKSGKKRKAGKAGKAGKGGKVRKGGKAGKAGKGGRSRRGDGDAFVDRHDGRGSASAKYANDNVVGKLELQAGSGIGGDESLFLRSQGNGDGFISASEADSLIAKGLVVVTAEGRMVLTEKGQQASDDWNAGRSGGGSGGGSSGGSGATGSIDSTPNLEVSDQLDRLADMLAQSRAFSTGMLELTIPNEMYVNSNNKLATAFGKIQ